MSDDLNMRAQSSENLKSNDWTDPIRNLDNQNVDNQNVDTEMQIDQKIDRYETSTGTNDRQLKSRQTKYRL